MLVTTATGIDESTTTAWRAAPDTLNSDVRPSATSGATSNDTQTATATSAGRFGAAARSNCMPRARIIKGSAASLSIVIGRSNGVGIAMPVASTDIAAAMP